MPSKDRPFLHHSMCSPHPEKSDVMMRLMIFANPALLGLLNGVVDIFIDPTFSCVPAPFYQCLIIMVFDPSTSHYLPVVYALMTHKVQELYWQMFNQLIVLTKWKMQVRTYTSDFELAMMNMLELHFGKNAGGGKHIGCFFHLKQAWRKYLIEKARAKPEPRARSASREGEARPTRERSAIRKPRGRSPSHEQTARAK